MILYHQVGLSILYVILGGCAIGCATIGTMTTENLQKSGTVIWEDESQKDEAKAVVVLLHGLNLSPQKMDDWSLLLAKNGAHVIRFALFGHTGDYEHMRTVKAYDWQKQFDEAMDIARVKAKQANVPIYFLGFSLGGLVCVDWLARNDDQTQGIEKMVLIAPALSVPWYSKTAIKILSVFGKGFMLPSRSPKHYRANRGTSIAAYEALFKLKRSLERKRYKNANIKTLILIDKEDELVDSRAIRDIIWKNKLGNWILEIVDNRFAHDNYGFRHLMVDQEAIGKDLWSSLSNMVLNHLELKK